MSRKIQLLPGGKYLSGGVLYKPGDKLPDTKETRELAKRKRAVLVEDEQDEQEEPRKQQKDKQKEEPSGGNERVS